VTPDFLTSKWAIPAVDLGLKVLDEYEDCNLIKSVLSFVRKAMDALKMDTQRGIFATILLNNFHKWDNRCDKVLIPILGDLASASMQPFDHYINYGTALKDLTNNSKQVCHHCFEGLRGYQLNVFIRDIRSIIRRERTEDCLISCAMLIESSTKTIEIDG